MTQDLQKKVDRAVRLIRQADSDGQVVEVAYSGGKDSDVILELTKMAGIKYRAIYKNTTIDPPGTIAHAKAAGAEIMRPKRTFFDLIAAKCFPSRFARFCCSELKEYKVLDRVIMGVRRAESIRRAARYSEPTECRFYGSKKEHVEAFYPILDWTDDDVVAFVTARGIRLHQLYYRPDGTIDPKRRLGCLCCPLKSRKARKAEFRKYPGMVRQYVKAGQRFRETHPKSAFCKSYSDIYEQFVRDTFFDRHQDFVEWRDGLFAPPDYKKFLEDYFNVKLPQY